MFTGIIENAGIIEQVTETGGNRSFRVRSSLTPELKVDQSLSHDGICLTVEGIEGQTYQVTAVAETLAKTNAGLWKPGDLLNLERAMRVNSRLDGHMVQGHVDTSGTCLDIEDLNGSWVFGFSFPERFAHLVIEKGSIAVNGISLTAWNVQKDRFSVAVIPYTYGHTNLRELKPGDRVNLEFDMVGKYIYRFQTLNAKA
jgi:riboflavin synthase